MYKSVLISLEKHSKLVLTSIASLNDKWVVVCYTPNFKKLRNHLRNSRLWNGDFAKKLRVSSPKWGFL